MSLTLAGGGLAVAGVAIARLFLVRREMRDGRRPSIAPAVVFARIGHAGECLLHGWASVRRVELLVAQALSAGGPVRAELAVPLPVGSVALARLQARLEPLAARGAHITVRRDPSLVQPNDRQTRVA